MNSMYVQTKIFIYLCLLPNTCIVLSFSLNWVDSFLPLKDIWALQHTLAGSKTPLVYKLQSYDSIIALIISGVPQGTVLGPILFLIFINDIYLCIKHSTIRCFEDDTSLLKAICNEADVTTLQSDLDSVIKWSVTNKMNLHEDKFEFICNRSTKSNCMPVFPLHYIKWKYPSSCRDCSGSRYHSIWRFVLGSLYKYNMWQSTANVSMGF